MTVEPPKKRFIIYYRRSPNRWEPLQSGVHDATCKRPALQDAIHCLRDSPAMARIVLRPDAEARHNATADLLGLIVPPGRLPGEGIPDGRFCVPLASVASSGLLLEHMVSPTLPPSEDVWRRAGAIRTGLRTQESIAVREAVAALTRV